MKGTMKKWVALAVVCLLLAGCATGVPQQAYDELAAQRDGLQARLDAQAAECEQHTEALSLAAGALAGAEEAAVQAEESAAQAEAAALQAGEVAALAEAALAEKQVELDAALETLSTTQAELTATRQQVTAVPAAAPQAQAQPTGGGTVWIPRTGSKYHSSSACSNMKNPSQVSLADAQAMGYGQCSKCW